MDVAGFAWQLGISLVAAGAVYGGIRADVRALIRSVDEAHRRIDSMMMASKG